MFFFNQNEDSPPSGICDLSRFWLFSLRPFILSLPNTFELFCFPIFRFWAYLMKVIPETRRTHWIWYLRFHILHNRTNTKQIQWSTEAVRSLYLWLIGWLLAAARSAAYISCIFRLSTNATKTVCKANGLPCFCILIFEFVEHGNRHKDFCLSNKAFCSGYEYACSFF